jgi:hypothetical protein
MSILEQLQKDHDRLGGLIVRLEDMLAGGAPPPTLELFGLRCEIARSLFAHFQLEDRILYPSLLARREPGVAAFACVLHEEIGILAADYFAHLDKWDPVAIERDWTGYRGESAILLIKVKARVEREHAELYPLLASLDDAAEDAAEDAA